MKLLCPQPGVPRRERWPRRDLSIGRVLKVTSKTRRLCREHILSNLRSPSRSSPKATTPYETQESHNPDRRSQNCLWPEATRSPESDLPTKTGRVVTLSMFSVTSKNTDKKYKNTIFII